MSSAYLEIVELDDGTFALQRMDSEDEPLVVIQFSEEVSEFLQDKQTVIAKAMIGAGVQAAGTLSKAIDEKDTSDEPAERTLH